MSRAKAVFIPPAKLVVVARSSYPKQKAQSTLFRVLCAFLHLAPLLRGHAVLLPEQFVEVGAVGKFEL